MKINTYKDLLIWQKGIELVVLIYRITQKFPKQEMYGLISQIRRASVSVPGNIAEGWGRNSRKSFNLFLTYSKGSLEELNTYNIISKKLNFINEEEFDLIKIKITELGKMIFGLQASIKEKSEKSFLAPTKPEKEI